MPSSGPNTPQKDARRTGSRAYDRFYILAPSFSSVDTSCTLEDGSVVLCAVEEETDARLVTADWSDLRVVHHSQLSEKDQERVEDALLN